MNSNEAENLSPENPVETNLNSNLAVPSHKSFATFTNSSFNISNAKPCTLTISNITKKLLTKPYVPFTTKLKNVFQKMRKGESVSNYTVEKDIIRMDQVQIEVGPGELVAIMGPSGAGKSTFLNIISGRIKPTTGFILVNDEPYNMYWRKMSSFIQQEDLLFESLTVKEYLTYEAALRLPKCPKELTAKRVETVMHEMNMTHAANSKIGSALLVKEKFISGGERKRVSIAAELITNPLLCFADEPTSSLDSFTAENVVKALENLTHKNKTVLCTIHQPSNRVLNYFTRVILISEGYLLFDGSLPQAILWFEHCGMPQIEYMNKSEYLLKCISTNSEDRGVSTDAIKQLADKWRTEKHSFLGTEEAPIKPLDDIQNLKQDKIVEGIKDSFAFSGTQFFTLLRRNFTLLSREKNVVVYRALSTTVVGLVLGFIYFRLTWNLEDTWNKVSACFILVMTQAFQSAISVSTIVISERPTIRNEAEAGSYLMPTYYCARFVSDFSVMCLFPILQIFIVWWLINFTSKTIKILYTILVLLLSMEVFNFYGYAMTTFIDQLEILLIAFQLSQVFFILFSGFLIEISSIPWVLRWITYLSPYRYGLATLSTVIFYDELVITDNGNITGSQFLFNVFGIDTGKFWLYIGLEFALMLGCCIICVVSSSIRFKKTSILN